MSIAMLIAAAAILVLPDISHAGSAQMLAELDAAELKWHQSRPEAYEFTFNYRAFFVYDDCRSRLFHVSVLNGSVADMNGCRSLKESFATVPLLFAHIRKVLAEKPDTASALFDPTLGYPLEFNVDRRENESDDEFYFGVSDFKVTNSPIESSAVDAPAQDLVAIVDLKFLRDTGKTAAVLCESDDDCVVWATQYLWKATVRKTISGVEPETQFLVLFGHHALKKKDIHGAITVMKRIESTSPTDARYQIIGWGEEKQLVCFSGAIASAPLKLEGHAADRLSCFDSVPSSESQEHASGR